MDVESQETADSRILGRKHSVGVTESQATSVKENGQTKFGVRILLDRYPKCCLSIFLHKCCLNPWIPPAPCFIAQCMNVVWPHSMTLHCSSTEYFQFLCRYIICRILNYGFLCMFRTHLWDICVVCLLKVLLIKGRVPNLIDLAFKAQTLHSSWKFNKM